MRVPERVHIVPLGYERDRATVPAKSYNADSVVIVTHDANDEKADEIVDDVTDILESEGISTSIEVTDLFNLYDSIEAIANVVTDHPDDELYINVSSGSKISAIAGFIVSNATETTAYYGKAARYEGVPEGFEDVMEMPTYPVNLPDPEEVLMMEAIRKISEAKEDPTKGDLIHVATQNGLAFTKRDVDSKAMYRLLDDRILDPLYEREYIDSYKDGRNVRIELTRTGGTACRAFRSLMDIGEMDYGSVLSDESNERTAS